MDAVTGVSDHIGWAEFVTISLRARLPVILDRRRVELIGGGIPSAPYHHEGLALPLLEAERIVARARKSIEEHCRAALSLAQSSYGIKAIVIQESPMKRLPVTLSEVLASRQVTCAADGMMYREALAEAGADLGLEVCRYPRKSDEIASAARALDVNRAAVENLIAEFGRQVGVPWRKEHRLAAASALRVLSSRPIVTPQRTPRG